MALLSRQVTQQANVLAYDDVFRVIAVLAALAFFTTLRVIGLRRRPTWLRLGPEGLEVSGPQGREAFAWADLTAVQAGPGPDEASVL